jgi:hypothetical protein
MVRDHAQNVSTEIVPFVKEFFARQRQVWTEKGGELISLPQSDQTAMIEKVSSAAYDLSKSKPELNEAVNTVFQSAKRNR